MIQANKSILFFFDKYFSVLNIINITFLMIGLYLVFFLCDEDYVQGNIYKIIYIHVPSAWFALFIYCIMSICSFGHVIYNNIYCSIYASSLSYVGMMFCFLCLITGSVWGKYTWGTWWVWDPRLTSMFVLLFFYIGYVLLWSHEYYYAKLASIVNLLGMINIPIIKFSVNLWSSLHQTSSFVTKKGIMIDFSMLYPILFFLLSNIIIAYLFFCIRYKKIIAIRKTHRLMKKIL